MSDTLLVETCNNDENGIGDILVTDLNSRLFPLIRYKVGDRGKIESIPCECGRELPVLTVLSGRCDEYIRCPDGTMVDPYVFGHILKEVRSGHVSIGQFRIVQKSLDAIEVKLVTQRELGQNILELIRDRFSTKLGDQIQVEIECVDQIPKDRSGKLRCFVSEIGRA
jgi:phenylacetate-CoA ligase